jgi:signal transduction histidine kinase
MSAPGVVAMSVRLKLIVIVLFVAVVPLSVSAVTSFGIHQRAFDGKLMELQRSAAQSGGRLAEEMLDGAARKLGLAVQAIEWGQLNTEEQQGALWLVYRQLDEVAAVSLLDGAGTLLAPRALLSRLERDPAFAAHPVVNESSLAALDRSLPLVRAREVRAQAPLLPLAPDEAPLLPVQFRVDGEGGRPWFVAVALSLRRVCRELGSSGPDTVVLAAVDERGRHVCGLADVPALAPLPELLAAALGRGQEVISYQDARGGRWMVSQGSMGRGWKVLAVQPEAVVKAASERIRRQTLLWIATSLVIALSAGLYLARDLDGPIQALARGAGELAKGNLGYRLLHTGRDEFGRLAGAFNHMGAEIERRDAEIRAWNSELQQRVEERTRELREAQRQLLESQKIAALSSLAAGVAHEINNPLTGVIGLAQVARSRAQGRPDGERDVAVLANIEEQAQRIRGIVQTLLGLSAEYAGEGFAEVELVPVIEQALLVLDGKRAAAQVAVVRRCDPTTGTVWGNAAQLRQVLVQVMTNALTAMPRGGTLTLATELVGGELVKVQIADTGKGIAPDHLARIFDPFFTTKDDWQGQGLGLTVAYRLVKQHHGTIKVDSTEGKGTTVVITLPRNRGGAHLV